MQWVCRRKKSGISYYKMQIVISLLDFWILVPDYVEIHFIFWTFEYLHENILIDSFFLNFRCDRLILYRFNLLQLFLNMHVKHEVTFTLTFRENSPNNWEILSIFSKLIDIGVNLFLFIVVRLFGIDSSNYLKDFFNYIWTMQVGWRLLIVMGDEVCCLFTKF